MKFIVSHDVDHLYRKDHYKDLFYPKLFVRETINFIFGDISFAQWYRRILSIFRRDHNNIYELVDFDIKHGVPSTFFFGMSKGFGLSYDKESSLDFINHVAKKGLSVGVHGIHSDDIDKMKKEKDSFFKLAEFSPCGIRMHCVRYNDKTFDYLDKCNYQFDSSEFDKEKGFYIKDPYQLEKMWEFPLTIMDAYLPKQLEAAKKASIAILNSARDENLEYITILFHDTYFCDAYEWTKDWYKWIIDYIKKCGYSFTNYEMAIKEMEQNERL